MTQTYTHTNRNGTYRITLTATEKRADTGQILVKYRLEKDGNLIMRGADLGASPMHAPESPECAAALLDFASSEQIDGHTKAEQKRLDAFRENDAEDLWQWQESLDNGGMTQ